MRPFLEHDITHGGSWRNNERGCITLTNSLWNGVVAEKPRFGQSDKPFIYQATAEAAISAPKSRQTGRITAFDPTDDSQPVESTYQRPLSHAHYTGRIDGPIAAKIAVPDCGGRFPQTC